MKQVNSKWLKSLAVHVVALMVAMSCALSMPLIAVWFVLVLMGLSDVVMFRSV